MTDQELLKEFEATTLPFEQWTHRSHVKVAFTYLRAWPFEEALVRMRRGVQAYNAAHHVPDGPERGYNETTTRAFLHLVAAVMAAYGQTHPTATGDEFCDMHPQLMTKHALRFFYSPGRRMHPKAKTAFVPPDLAPLPLIPGTADGRG